ncbi:hypothetical protein [Saccharothrix xinjiangensis]|uniref:Uncharacterized protein n=1 Tax=Saccharothrix xinjiangensis TaxID=204798 RepID=A0ABV9XVX8_9PSEU
MLFLAPTGVAVDQAVDQDIANQAAQHRFATAEQQRCTAQVEAVEREVGAFLPKFAGAGPADLMMRITDPGSCARVRRIAITPSG